ncbi:hypothetical protein [Streptomyces sp. NPDC050145]|uniref:hypothetical protein n=1 Tax=Streptomyces sp. NPDC050145 TaxID=3365602 RepID=UPI0037A2F5F4
MSPHVPPIADACAAVIAAAFYEALVEYPHADPAVLARHASQRAVRDLEAQGWHIPAAAQLAAVSEGVSR